MINDTDIDEMIQPILNLYSQMEMDLMVEVAKRFARYDEIAGSLEWQLKKLDELGGVNKNLVKIIKQYSDMTEPQIKQMLQKAGYVNLDVNVLGKAYELGASAVDPKVLMRSENIVQIINLSYKSLTDTFSMINTKALESAKQKYLNILNTAYLDTATGIHSYQESINNAIGQMAKEGIGGATYKRGKRYVTYSLEGTVRRDTLTAVHQLANKVSMQSCEEMNCGYVEISKHLGARVHPTNPIANHAGWQGKVFKINGSDSEYPNLKASTGYPDDILGLGGVNCRHRMFPFFPGISIANPVKYNEEENRKVYEATQHQRKLERDIRGLKKRKACAEAVGDDDTASLMQYKLNQKYKEIDEWCSIHNLRRDYSRELVSEQMVKTEYTIDKQTGNISVSSVSSADKAMYQKYKTALGKNAPESLEKFIDIKYNDADSWKMLKSLARSKNYLQEQLAFTNFGKKEFIPRHTVFYSKPISIAGNGAEKKIRIVDKLIEKYPNCNDGNEWSKRVATIKSNKYLFDVHWYEYNGIQYEMKLKYRKENKK